MELFKVFIQNLDISDGFSFVAILISAISLFFSYSNRKSNQRIEKFQMLCEISENLTKTKMELLNAVSKLRDYGEHLTLIDSKTKLKDQIETLNIKLKEVDEILKITRDALDIGLSIEYQELFILKNYAKNSLVNFESMRKNVLLDIEKFIDKNGL